MRKNKKNKNNIKQLHQELRYFIAVIFNIDFSYFV